MAERPFGMSTLLGFFKCERQITCERKLTPCSRNGNGPKTPVFVGEGLGGYKVVEKVVWVGEGKGSVDLERGDDAGNSCLSQDTCRRVFYYFLFFGLISCLVVGIGGLVPAALGMDTFSQGFPFSRGSEQKATTVLDRKTSDVSSTDKNLDCDTGYERLLGLDWTNDKKEWCCEHRHRGCPMRAASPPAREKSDANAALAKSEVGSTGRDNTKIQAWNAALHALKQADKETKGRSIGSQASDNGVSSEPRPAASQFRSWPQADEEIEDDLVKQIVQRSAVDTLRSQVKVQPSA